MSRELLEKSLIALKQARDFTGLDTQVISDIEEELAKPEPEPVAWRRLDTEKSVMTENPDIAKGWQLDGLPFEALYTHLPAQLKPIYLSDSEVDFIISSPWMNKIARETYTEFAREIEQAVLKANGLMKGDL